MDEIANTTESASRIGEGKSIGYGFSSSTCTDVETTEFDWSVSLSRSKVFTFSGGSAEYRGANLQSAVLKWRPLLSPMMRAG